MVYSVGSAGSVGVLESRSRLERPLLDLPEQLLSLLGRHGFGTLQQVCDDQRLLHAGRFDPNASVHPDHKLTREEVLKV